MSQTTNLKGYRLHSARINYSGYDSAMRTIKFPVEHADPQTTEDIVLKVFADDRAINGVHNLDDYIAGVTSYSIIEFYVECLRVGAIFGNSTADLPNTIAVMTGSAVTASQRLDASPIKNDIDLERAKALVLQTGFRTPKNARNKVELYVAKMLSAFKDEFRQKYAHDVSTAAKAIFEDPKTYIDTIEELFQLAPVEKYEVPGAMYLMDLPELSADIPGSHVIRQRLRELRDRICPGNPGFAPKEVMAALGLTGSYNGFSYLFGAVANSLRDGGLQELIEAYLAATPVWKGKRAELTSRLERLAVAARKLSPMHFGQHAEFRASMGGKIASWLSNEVNHAILIRDHLALQKAELTKAVDLVRAVAGTDAAPADNGVALLADLATLDRIVDGLMKSAAEGQPLDVRQVEAFNGIRAHNKYIINQIIQPDEAQAFLRGERSETTTDVRKHQKNKSNKKDVKKDDDARVTFDAAFPGLAEPSRTDGDFYGAAKVARFKKFKDAAILTERAWAAVKTIYEIQQPAAEASTEVSFPEMLQRLVRLWRKLTHPTFKNAVAKALSSYVDVADLARDTEAVVWQRPKTRRKHPVIEVPTPEDLRMAYIEIGKAIAAVGFEWKTLGAAERIELVELHKTALSIVIAGCKSTIGIGDLDITGLEAAEGMRAIFGNTISSHQLDLFVQAGLCSELRGLGSLMSKERILTRAEIQSLNGGQSMLLYTPTNAKGGTMPADLRELAAGMTPADVAAKALKEGPAANGRLMRHYPHSFAYTLSCEGPGADVGPAVLFNDKKEAVPFKKAAPVVNVKTSKYQLQFLEWMLSAPAKAKTDMTLSGSFLIAEYELAISWDLERLEVSVTAVPGTHRLFVSQPFKMLPRSGRRDLKTSETYIGADIGEYGIGYSVVRFPDGKPVVIEKGFIKEPRLALLRGADVKLKNRQRIGTFSDPSTYMARLRADLTTSLRNKLHSVAVQHEAKIVHERYRNDNSVGGKDIKHIFSTLAKSDVYTDTDSDKIVRKQVWGTDQAAGRVVSGYASSQTCTCCGRWYKNFITDDDLAEQGGKRNLSVEIIDPQGIDFDPTPPTSKKRGLLVTAYDKSIVTVENKNGVKIYGYSEKEIAVGSLVKPDDFRKMAYAYLRPPMGGAVWGKVHAHLQTEFLSENWRADRGNSAVFVCPMGDCHHVDDADVQASYNLAVAGYGQDRAPKKEKKGKNGDNSGRHAIR